jgi:23S rRNA (guanine2445-N2)-methyltransferase / 23S rRNA (guanine2069-N7)-methyltransferase
MAENFDVQRDHVALLHATADLLAPAGEILFSSNRRRFALDRDGLARFEVRDVTRATIPKDFENSRRVRSCFRLRRQ